jgi:cytochrome c oxidase subunit 2
MPKFLTRHLAVVALLGFAALPALADQPKPWGLGMQDAASPTMQGIISLHTTLTVIITCITLFVFGLLAVICVRFNASRNPVPAKWSHNTLLELVWTLVPVLILVAIAFPSFRLLYAADRVKDADYTLKVTGHQWFWSYSYVDQGIAFDSNLAQDSDLKPGEPRLLATDTHVVLPVGAIIRIQTTADDVIHSWSVPALGVKIDAFPGRLNETWTRIDRPGIYYGQCSQLCGINHGFMPIEIEAVSKEDFAAWVEQNQSKKSSSAGQSLFAAASKQGNDRQ